MKKRRTNAYAQFYSQLSDAEKLELGSFFSGLRRRIWLPKKQKNAMRQDFEAAVLVLVQSGVPLREALGRLSLCRLGDFYSAPPSRWYPLDDAAKIYPLSMSHREIKMFRLSVYLAEPVVPELLQVALTFTICRYPFFAATVKKGFFWHYLDSVRIALVPCDVLHEPDQRGIFSYSDGCDRRNGIFENAGGRISAAARR